MGGWFLTAEHKSQARRGSHATAPRALGKRRLSPPPAPGQHPRRPVKSQAWAEDKREDLRQLGAELGRASSPPIATGQQSLSADGRARRSRLPTIRLAHADRRRGGGATSRTLRSPWTGHAKHGPWHPGSRSPSLGTPSEGSSQGTGRRPLRWEEPPQTTRSTPRRQQGGPLRRATRESRALRLSASIRVPETGSTAPELSPVTPRDRHTGRPPGATRAAGQLCGSQAVGGRPHRQLTHRAHAGTHAGFLRQI